MAGNHLEPILKEVNQSPAEAKHGTQEVAVDTPSRSEVHSSAPVNKSGPFDPALVAPGEPTGEELPALLEVH